MKLLSGHSKESEIHPLQETRVFRMLCQYHNTSRGLSLSYELKTFSEFLDINS